MNSVIDRSYVLKTKCYMFLFFNIINFSGSRIARIALKTSAIERSQFFTSKLYPTFFFNSEKKLFFEIEKKSEIFFENFSKSGKNQLFHRKNHCFFNEKTMIFSMKKLIFFRFWKIPKKNLRFFFDLKKKVFFRSWKKSWVQLRCKKLRSLDCWCFQSDPSNPTAARSKKDFFSLFRTSMIPTWWNLLMRNYPFSRSRKSRQS